MGVWPERYADNKRCLGVEIEKPGLIHELIILEEATKLGSGGLIWGLFGGMGIGLPPLLKFADRAL